MFNGKTHHFDWAMFNSKQLNYQRVNEYSSGNSVDYCGHIVEIFWKYRRNNDILWIIVDLLRIIVEILWIIVEIRG